MCLESSVVTGLPRCVEVRNQSSKPMSSAHLRPTHRQADRTPVVTACGDETAGQDRAWGGLPNARRRRPAPGRFGTYARCGRVRYSCLPVPPAFVTVLSMLDV